MQCSDGLKLSFYSFHSCSLTRIRSWMQHGPSLIAQPTASVVLGLTLFLQMMVTRSAQTRDPSVVITLFPALQVILI